MRRALIVVLVLVLVALASPAGAITYGVPDGDGHPSVGALLAAEAFSDGTWALCSGTLISSTVFVTAAHCFDGEDHVAVTFDSVYDAKRGKEYWGTFHSHPGYNHHQDDTMDLAVVVFDHAVKSITPSRLPAEGSLSNLSGDQRFTSVGYGAQEVKNAPGGKQFTYQDVRYVSTGTLNSINETWLRISQNPAKGDGGTCYGDSGGPNFLGAGDTETDIVASTTITGDAFCRSTNVTYRLDTESARSFLGQFVELP